jgi:2-polyprenyl-6-methoxyphenol hydroxylase-like FAD-dependent oxidoreductase
VAEVVIVGGGVGGGALATVLARAGLDVTVLERSVRYEDRVRGEWLAPWGVLEARELGLYDTLVRAGGHHLGRHVTYDETLDPAAAEAAGFPLEPFAAGVPGPLTLGHPALCEAYEAAALAAGAVVRRGVRNVRVEPGDSPTVTAEDATGEITLRPGLVVGADGRDSAVRRQLGIALFEDAPHHLFAGLLVDGAPEWPDTVQAIATEGALSFLAFPQGGGRIRLYAAHPLSDRGRFTGPEGAARFVDACVMACCPLSPTLRAATPAGPCRSFNNADAWAERVTAPGVVLIGDAAGHNDPLIGQGLSITHRDVRMVRDVLLAGSDRGVATFAPYVAERQERMRRLRIAAAFQARVEAEFDDAARRRRVELFGQAQADPADAFSLIAALAGPGAVPGDVYARFESLLPPAPAWPTS